jgi:hypothetical protein
VSDGLPQFFHNSWGWLALFLLGGYHGVNPGMGWLFAVALGMQENNIRAVVRSLAPSLSATRWPSAP